MVDNVRRECIMSMYEIYPLSRKLVFDTFDKKKYDITRTQQIIMLSLCIEGTLTMSQLASKINTEKMNDPSFMMVLTGTGDYAYRRKDGVYVVPIGCLKD